jgi:hypothetical protein
MIIVRATVILMLFALQVHLSAGFTVEYSSCECANGQFQCHHVAAILLHGLVLIAVLPSLSWLLIVIKR